MQLEHRLHSKPCLLLTCLAGQWLWKTKNTWDGSHLWLGSRQKEQGKRSNSGSGPVVLYFGPFSKRVDGGLVYWYNWWLISSHSRFFWSSVSLGRKSIRPMTNNTAYHISFLVKLGFSVLLLPKKGPAIWTILATISIITWMFCVKLT